MIILRARRFTAMLISLWTLCLLTAEAPGARAREPMLFGGCGGAYFLAEPGTLVIDLVKRDRNEVEQPTVLRAVLVGPDRQPVAQVEIPDDRRPVGSGLGPPRQARLTAKVQRQGVYALIVTITNDRYGEHAVWGLTTNCPHYLLETDRGHKNLIHQEPLVLDNPDRPGDVCFLPGAGAVKIEVADLPDDVTQLSLFDASGKLLTQLPVTGGSSAQTLAADTPRDGTPWRLHLPRAKGVVQIDGLTRWQSSDPAADMCLWTPEVAAWFDLSDNCWLVTPYHQTIYDLPGKQITATFRFHNHAPQQRTINLKLESDDSSIADAQLSAEQVTLPADADAEVTVTCPVPSAKQKRFAIHLLASPATDSDFSTYATLNLIAGRAPAEKPLKMPIVLHPYQHENAQFGYRPQYPSDWEMYFDLNNRPMTRTGTGFAVLRDDGWTTSTFPQSVRLADNGAPASDRSFAVNRSTTKIAFDRDNDIYLLDNSDHKATLLHSGDGGLTFTAYDLGQSGALDIEQFTGHNVPDGPPPMLRSISTQARDPDHFWRSVSSLELILAEKHDGKLRIDKPILIAEDSLGLGSHSGLATSVVSHGSKVHVIWGVATDPNAPGPGVPTYVVTYDREKQQFDGKPVLIGYGAPPNDGHNRPCILIDSKGYLHAMTGTHNAPFQYARSLQPNTAHGGWTEAQSLGEGLRQTYVGLVCGTNDTLHLVYRLWCDDQKPYPQAVFAQLTHQRKPSGKPWEPPRPLVIPPFSEYSVFYHRLNIDRDGRIFICYDYWSTFWFYRNDQPDNHRATIFSSDGGRSWKLACDDDLIE